MFDLRLLRIALLGAAALTASGVVAGCGGGDGDADPMTVLEQTFSPANDVESGELRARFDFSVDSEELQKVEVSGPFTGVGEGVAPRFDSQSTTDSRAEGKNST